MKKLLLLACCCLFLGFQKKKSAEMRLDYFIGKWEVKMWTGTETKQEPMATAAWFMDKDLDSAGNYKGYVQMGNMVYTSETISWNEKKELYTRHISVNNGIRIELQTTGWVNDKLTWAGIKNDGSNKIRMKEEITKKDPDNFKAVFYEERDGKWVLIQTELLNRIN